MVTAVSGFTCRPRGTTRGGGGGGGGRGVVAGDVGNVQTMTFIPLPMINQQPPAAPPAIEGGCQSTTGESSQGQAVISADILPS